MKTRINSKRICIVYPDGAIKFFSIMILGIIMMSCSSPSGRRVAEQKRTEKNFINNNEVLISDDAFINNLNSFDATAVVHDLYIDSENDFTGNTYCIIIEANDSLFIYKGKGSYMQRYYKNRVKGDFVKQ